MRKIIHVDMDCFYAAVEVRDNPQLANQPVAVGGPAGGRGVLSTCNYQAREFGVRSAMPSGEALRRCPNLIIVPGRMAVYQQVSQQIRAIFERYTDKIEPLSLDEAFLDVSDCQACRGSATLIAEQIRAEIFATTGLTASAGVANCKFIAKIASDENKPNGQCVVLPQHVASFSAALPLRKIPGVGPKTAERLSARGLNIGADVLKHSPEQLAQWLGKFGPVLHQRAQGIDPREVISHRERKSVGVETTLSEDLGSETECLHQLRKLLPKLSQRLGTKRFKGINIKLKFSDFQQTTVSTQAQQLDESTLRALLQTGYQRGHGRGVRLVGISVNLDDSKVEQLSLL
ncbi:DNA polymerase IV [uncultured Ferrimonas sp.]|uniref:DNA polymerase IV n=1 Tax=uncultured Ferrimonas sp. TaxID=432640 RepID=UPI00260BE48F|nr:DNA polymerase IV [uncultured Ferrimonas sp.]